ncbi:P-type DNA transfer protein VirB5 [Asticcacaulis sp. W401b]|uniref:P-type DNA transfer protein VirB5 n=1 Tax=Asticcacaulis sp. W401b TaxID=3388666 RepID=UPI00397060BA
MSVLDYLRRSKSARLSATAAAFLVTAVTANAAMPVVDVSNLAQAVKQVQAWKQQFDQMNQQITQLQQTYLKAKGQLDALTGARGIGEILNNPLVRQVAPDEVVSAYNMLDVRGAEGLTDVARTLRADATVYDCGDQIGDRKRQCEAGLAIGYQDIAYQQQTLDRLQNRSTQIEALRSQINLTQDPKAIAELQARIAVEQAHVQNDANRIAAVNALSQSQQQVQQQRQRERTMKRYAKDAPSATDSFVFTMPVS